MDVSSVSIIQTAVAGSLVLVYIFHLVFPSGPQWMRSFAKEEPWLNGCRPAKLWSGRNSSLLVLSLFGLVLTILSASREPSNAFKWIDSTPWASLVLLVAAQRPRKTPKTILALLLVILMGSIVSLAIEIPADHRVDAQLLATSLIAVVAIFVILSMPMRHPDLEATGIATSKDDTPTVELRSPEDNMTLWQFMTVCWMSPLIKHGSTKTLNDENVWLLPYDFQHARLLLLFRDLQGSIIVKLLVANGLDLIIITFLGILESAANLSGPILLRWLLQAINKGPTFGYETITYAAAMLIFRLIACQSSVFSLWFSRRAYERSRGEMITTIYAKTLTRKSQGFHPDEKKSGDANGNGLANGNGNSNGSAGTMVKPSFVRWIGSCFNWSKTPKPVEVKHKAPATMGKILNLLRADCYEVAQRFWEFPSLITKPLQFVLSLTLVWTLLGWPCLVGVAWVVIVQLLNATFVRQLIRRERDRRIATDNRLQVTSQFVEAIRHLRWYDWQAKWLEKIMDTRRVELNLRIVTGFWNIAIATINVSGGALFPVASFFAYTYLAGNSLPVDIAFAALQLFGILETNLKELPDLITTLLNASIAAGRLEDFMKEPDKEENFSNDEVSGIEFHDASLAWPGTPQAVLKNLNLRFTDGLTVVFGKVGSGKTALLQSILGELDLLSGESIVPNEMVGYCAQSPWLQHMSIRENILFCAPYDPVRYRQVLDVCALTPDLANFKQGDLSNIGENGIGLSGGQKARVALARAVYSQSRILLLDDPLAALDHHTAETIVQKLFGGNLVLGRTIVLVTHRVDLCIHLADQVVEVADATARVLDAEEIPQHVASHATTSQAATQSTPLDAPTEEQQDAAVPDKFIEDEHRASGGVVASVYWTYIKAGRLDLWAVTIAIYTVLRLGRLLSVWFVTVWTEASNNMVEVHRFGTSVFLYPDVDALDKLLAAAHSNATRSGLFGSLPDPEDDVGPWLLWYLAIALVTTFVFFLSQASLLVIMYTASKALFIKVLDKVSNANFRFYDVTPIGRLMNRLTSDIGMLDGGIMSPLQSLAFWGINWIWAMAIIAYTTRGFFVVALLMSIVFVLIFLRFLPTSQSLRRLEMVSLSPLMSNFGILLDGLATIRAFKAQAHFQGRNIVITDAFQKMDHFYWSLQAWLMYRFDTLSALCTFMLTMIALYYELSPGLTAFVLNNVSQFVDATHALCRVYGQLQMDFVSVERVVELLDLEEEPVGDIDPPAAWPSYGDDITFENVTMKYAPHLEPSLIDVDFTIPGGSTCAVLGRTGSGKSTLAYALLATLRPEKGSIRVGAMDISQVNVHTWRQRISFVAQDPVLFPGTLRQNIDPLEEHSDEECIAVLHRVLGPEWTLSTRVDSGGKNLSQGQRQLVGIARAVLRRSPVIVLDEATASIDKKTAMAIQEVLRDELKQSTVITIAHRLEAVKGADYFVRLDAGRVVEWGPATKM